MFRGSEEAPRPCRSSSQTTEEGSTGHLVLVSLRRESDAGYGTIEKTGTKNVTAKVKKHFWGAINRKQTQKGQVPSPSSGLLVSL